jgi:hypothetical protein
MPSALPSGLPAVPTELPVSPQDMLGNMNSTNPVAAQCAEKYVLFDVYRSKLLYFISRYIRSFCNVVIRIL